MRYKKVEVLDVKIEAPSTTYIFYQIDCGRYIRRGVIVYDHVMQKFCSHNKDIELLAMVCRDLRNLYKKSINASEDNR